MGRVWTVSQEAGLYDISFNFVVGYFGVFECRGWNAKPDLIPSKDFQNYPKPLFENYISIGIITCCYDEYFITTIFKLMFDGFVLGKVGRTVDVLCGADIQPFCKNITEIIHGVF